MPTYRVHYGYNGGAGCVEVEAADSKSAIDLGMRQAVPRWNPGESCQLVRVERIMTIDELNALPNRGLEKVQVRPWVEDRGHPYLVVSRTINFDSRYSDVWTETGTLEQSAPSRKQAESVAKNLRKKNLRTLAQYDVVRRDSVTVEPWSRA